jgi:hypothetical protein
MNEKSLVFKKVPECLSVSFTFRRRGDVPISVEIRVAGIAG